MDLASIRRAMGALACAVLPHRFEVWVRADDRPATRHAHLGAWARCERCGLERDWLGAVGVRPADTALVLDRVHGVRRPLADVIASARGELGALPTPKARERAATSDPARTSARPIRRGRAGRSSTRSVRPGEGVPARDPSDRER